MFYDTNVFYMPKKSLKKVNEMKKGRFVVVDGLDGVGKGVFLDAFVEEAKRQGKKVLDVDLFELHNSRLPSSSEVIEKYDLIKTSEPTYSGVGKIIREEYTRKGSSYSARIVGEAFALARRVLYEQLLIPVLEAGVDVYQSRSFSTSIIFQPQQAASEGSSLTVAEILSIPGNKFCTEHPMDYLIVPTLNDVVEVVHRFSNRDKKDNCKYENVEFQLKVKPHYESEEFKKLFESLGVKVVYLDAGVSIEHSQQQARDFYQQHLRK